MQINPWAKENTARNRSAGIYDMVIIHDHDVDISDQGLLEALALQPGWLDSTCVSHSEPALHKDHRGM